MRITWYWVGVTSADDGINALSSCRAHTLSGRRRLSGGGSLSGRRRRLSGGGSLGTTGLRSWRDGGHARRTASRSRRGTRLTSHGAERRRDGTIDVVKGAKTISEFVARATLQQRAPPTHQNDEAGDSGRPTNTNTGGLHFPPPAHDLGTKGVGLKAIVLLVVMGVFIEAGKNFWPSLRRKLRFGLRDVSRTSRGFGSGMTHGFRKAECLLEPIPV